MPKTKLITSTVTTIQWQF